MNGTVAIHQLSEQMGLTSRTLRHWEAEGLFRSDRDPSSGWRMYGEEAILCIRITAMLRKMNIPLKDVKAVVADRSLSQLSAVIERKRAELQSQHTESCRFLERLRHIQQFLEEQEGSTHVEDLITETEDLFMRNVTENSSSRVRIIALPPMKVAYHIAIGVSPEEEAMAPVLEWIKDNRLLSTARFLGGNVKPMPGRPGKLYGYGMCATIPDGVEVPAPLKEMTLPGGLYARYDSSEDVSLSWKTFMRELGENSLYQSDRSRLCFEEHIRNEQPDGCGNEYHLILLEPVKKAGSSDASRIGL